MGLVTGMSRIGGVGAQTYDALAGAMKVDKGRSCDDPGEFAELTGIVVDLSSNLDSP